MSGCSSDEERENPQHLILSPLEGVSSIKASGSEQKKYIRGYILFNVLIFFVSDCYFIKHKLLKAFHERQINLHAETLRFTTRFGEVHPLERKA